MQFQAQESFIYFYFQCETKSFIILFVLFNTSFAIHIPGEPKKLNITFSYNFDCLAATIRLLFNPPNPPDEEKSLLLLCILKWPPQRDNRLEVSSLFHAGHKVSEVATLVGVSRITVCAIKKRIDDGEGVCCGS